MTHTVAEQPTRRRISMGSSHERRQRKNAQSRARAEALRELVAATKLKPASQRTKEEQDILDEFEQRRLKKNIHCRRRNDLQKKELYRILDKSPAKRSLTECAFLNAQMKRKLRKNEGDRLRRLRRRNGLSSESWLQQPMPMSRHATSTAMLQQKLYSNEDGEEDEEENEGGTVGENQEELLDLDDDYAEENMGESPADFIEELARELREARKQGPLKGSAADETAVFQGGMETAPSFASLNTEEGVGEEDQGKKGVQATAEELIRDFELEGDVAFGTGAEHLPPASTLLPLDTATQPQQQMTPSAFVPLYRPDALRKHAIPQVLKGPLIPPLQHHAVGRANLVPARPPFALPNMPGMATHPAQLFPTTPWTRAAMQPRMVAPFPLPPPHLMHHYYPAPPVGTGIRWPSSWVPPSVVGSAPPQPPNWPSAGPATAQETPSTIFELDGIGGHAMWTPRQTQEI